MKISSLFLTALLLAASSLPCLAEPAPVAGQMGVTANPPAGEARNSMFETDVEKMQLGHNDGAPAGVQTRNAQASGDQFEASKPLNPAQAGNNPPAKLPDIPLGNMDESNAALQLGTSLPKGSVWQLNSFASAQGGHPHQVFKLSPSAALTVYFDPARRRAVKISIEVVHVPSVYGPQAKSTFENEVLMAVLFGGNLFVEMENNHQLAKAMQDRLSLRDAALLQGKVIDFGLTQVPIVYSARLEGGRYTLDITGKSH